MWSYTRRESWYYMLLGALGLAAVIIIILVVVLNYNSKNEKKMALKTKCGVITGDSGGRTRNGGKLIHRFNSIPYAEPPIGELRFELGGQEKLPVLVFIHGGAFHLGDSNLIDKDPDLLLEEDVVVASINYRLGIFGFLSTGDVVVPGNNGLRDQILGLEWLKENIEDFGGDSEKMVLFGQDAGATSIGFLLQSPLTEGLFSGVIMQSGSTTIPLAISEVDPETLKSLCSLLAIDIGETQAMINGLKSEDAGGIQSVAMDLFRQGMEDKSFMYGPVVEPEHKGAIIRKHPDSETIERNMPNLPVIIGHGTLEYLKDMLDDFSPTSSKYVLAVNMNDDKKNYGRTSALHNNENRTSSMLQSELIAMKLDASNDEYERPIREKAILYSKKCDVYFYHFSYRGELSRGDGYWLEDAQYTNELRYIFTYDDEDQLNPDDPVKMRMTKMWANFAKTGNPTPIIDHELQNVKWPLFSETRQPYLIIGENLRVSFQKSNH